MWMLDSDASPDWMKTSDVVMGSSSSLVDAAAVEVVVDVVLSWADVEGRKASSAMNGTFIFDFGAVTEVVVVVVFFY